MEEGKESKEMRLNDDGCRIRRQVEYYFSDVNIVRDKFLLQQFKKDDGWVKLSILATFARLSQLTTDVDRIVEALKEQESSIIELDEENKKVRRIKRVPNLDELQLDARTAHISGFPLDYKFDKLLNFCTQLGEVESLRMRRHLKTKTFKGCIHVVFKHKHAVKKVLNTSLDCNGQKLLKESMDDYRKRKKIV